MYNNIIDLNKINLIDELNQHKYLFKEITSFKFKENLKLKKNNIDYYNQIKNDEEIKKYILKLTNKNKDEFDLANLDFIIQNIIVESTKCNLYFYLKEKNIFIKLKSNKNKHLHLEEKEYNLPLLPMSF